LSLSAVYDKYWLGIFLQVAATLSPDNPFFKEILTGRCYDLVPNECPRLVDAFMGAIEGTLDQDVAQPGSFQAYFEAANEQPAYITFRFE
jgi:hypothetical protein